MRRMTLLTLALLAATSHAALAQQATSAQPAGEAPKPVVTQTITPAQDAPAAAPEATKPAEAPATTATPASAAEAMPVIINQDIARIGHTAGGRDVDEVTLISGPVLVLKVAGRLDAVPETFNKGFEQLLGALNGAGLKAVNAPMAVYTSIDDSSFKADLMVAVTAMPETAPKGLAIGRSPSGKAIRVLHIGPMEKIEEAYADLETFVDDKGLNLRDIFLERYLTEPSTTPANDMRTEIYVLTK